MTKPGKPVRTTRRDLLRAATVAAPLAALSASSFANWAVATTQASPRNILLHSGWQWVNIGDIAQTPGGLHLLEQHFPNAKLTLWLSKTTEPITAMLRTRFPKVRIVEGTIDKSSLAVKGDELKQALSEADLCIHGSSSAVTTPEFLAWCQANKKPFGLLGVTIGVIDEKLISLLANARFIFTRETHSLAALKRAGVKGPVMGFAPDSVFAFDLRDDMGAMPYLQMVGLEEGKFICCIPRLRYTPYRRLKPEEIKLRTEMNQKFAEPDHAKMRAAMTAIVRKTGHRVLLCPEMSYQIDIMDKLLIEPLPDDVRMQVVKRTTFWLPDEAASIYARAAAVLSFEVHSPVIALTVGTPAVYLHQPTEIRKEQMIRDIGLAEWTYEIDDVSAEKVSQTVSAIVADPMAAKQKIKKAMNVVSEKYKSAIDVVRQSA